MATERQTDEDYCLTEIDVTQMHHDLYALEEEMSRPGNVGTNDMSDKSVTTQKLGDGSVTNAKISNGSVSADKLAGDVWNVIRDKFFPVGSVFITTGYNPASKFGGSWSQITGGYLYCGGGNGQRMGSDGFYIEPGNLPKHSHWVGDHSHSVAVAIGGHNHWPGLDEGDTHDFVAINKNALARYRVATSSTNNAWCPGTGSNASTNIRFPLTNWVDLGTKYGNTTGTSGVNTGDGPGWKGRIDYRPPGMNLTVWRRTA